MITPPRAVLPLAEGPFDLVAGLPVHALVVHVAVVLLPLSALALIVVVLVPRARRAFAWVTLAGLAVSTVAAFVAKESGEQLAERVGTPQQHADLGGTLPLLAGILLLIAVGWFVLQRMAAGRRTVATVIAGTAAIVMAVLVIVMTVVVGHTGATAVWSGTVAATSDRVAAAEATTPAPDASAAAPSAASSADPAPAATADSGSGAATYTLADVAAHADRSSCWAAIDGTVYDLTSWVGQHPGGADRILSICGTDATSAFTAQHGGEQRPANELTQFAIGSLAS